MSKLIISLNLSLLLFTCAPVWAQGQKHHKVVKLMGSRFEITAIHENAQTAWDGINAAIAEITRIERLISSWDPNSQTSEINRQAGLSPIKVDQELFELIKRGLRVSRLTDGAFDMSYASMDRIWKFDGSMIELPAPELVAKAAAKIDYKNIVLNDSEHTVYLREKGMNALFPFLPLENYSSLILRLEKRSMG